MEWKKVLAATLVVCLVTPPVYSTDPHKATGTPDAPVEQTAAEASLVPTAEDRPAVASAMQGPVAAVTCANAIAGQSDVVRERVAASMLKADAAIAKTRREIQEIVQLAEAAGQCEDRTVQYCAAAFTLIKKVQLILRPLAIGFRTELGAVNPNKTLVGSVRDFAHTIYEQFFKTFQRDSMTLSALRTDPQALWNYIKNLSSIYLFQLMAWGTQVATNPQYNAGVIWPILLNTGVMVTLQSNKGTENTDRKLELPTAANLDELNAQLPAMLAGTDGYKQEVAKRFAGFIALWPPEVLLVVLGSGLQEFLAPAGGDTAFLYNTPARIVAITAASIGIFGSYLALRWSVFDFWFNLRYLPAYQAVQKATFEKREAELTERLQALMAEADVQVPESLSWFGWATQRFTESGRIHREKAARYAAFRLREDVREIENQMSQNIWGRRQGLAVEATYRLGLQFFDAFVIFGLMGEWVPAMVDWMFGFQIPR